MARRTFRLPIDSIALAVLVLGSAGQGLASAGAQPDGAIVRGEVLHSLTGKPLAGAVVVFQEDGRYAVTGSDGKFRFERVAPGTYHLIVETPGFSTKHQEFEIKAPETIANLLVDPELHFAEVVSVSARPRDQFDAYQPTSVLFGQELTRELGSTVAATVGSQPGVTERSFGGAPARPVIRGFDGDRVLILEDGRRMGDLSSQSGDHGITVNPASASRIEVVRGPATLLHGANGIGGLVNVISNAVPSEAVNGVKGVFTGDVGSNGMPAQAAADLWWGNGSVAVHAGGGGQRSGDYSTPEGEVANTQSRSGFGSFGLSWTGSRGYVGANYAYEDTRYGLPFIEDGRVELTPRRSIVNVRAEARDLQGLFSSVRASLAARRYRHEEIAGGEAGTRFRNDTDEAEVLATHRRFGTLGGTVGAWALDRRFAAAGDEALSPPVDQRAAAAFAYEEVTWHHATLQASGRLDATRYEPRGGVLRPRSFATFSGSVGLLVKPPFAGHSTSFALSLTRATRYPALEELYFHGPHPGNVAYEIGNQDLDPERALGVDVSFRWRSPRFETEATYFYNRIGGYIFRRPVERAVEEEFPVVEYVAEDGRLQGFELHGDAQLGPRLIAQFGMDYVRGTLAGPGTPLPRIPPLRARASLRYQLQAFNAGAEVTAVAAQNRVSGAETSTSGYGLLKLFSSYSWPSGRAVNTMTLRIDNATNTLYRSHLSYVKDHVAERGRSVKVVYSVAF